jgi:hypothetical protein
MPRPTEIQSIIEEAVAEVFASALPGLRAEIVRRATAELEVLIPAPGSSPTDILNAAAASIQEATSQADILRHLLEGEARFAGRVALFVVKAGAISGWQGTGFQDNEVVKGISLNASASLVARAIQGRVSVAGTTADFDPAFVAAVTAPAEGNCMVLPLVVKDKVAALIYADAGTVPGGVLDGSALNVLNRWAALWLELTALRKAAQSSAPEEPAPSPAPAPTPSAPPPAAAAVPAAAEESDLHRKARRFAKLLVEEIKLYNQAKVIEGKSNRDLYDRLKEDIEKSRSTYQKRYGESPAASADYFNQELVRILADDDASLMGAAFPR